MSQQDNRSILKRLSHAIEAGFFLGFMGFSRLLGVKNASAFLGKIAKSLGPKTPLNKRALKNLRLCFPDKSEADLSAIIADMWENLGRTIAEYAHLDQIRNFKETGLITVKGEEHLQAIKNSPSGNICFSGHFANWEIGPMPLRELGMDVGGIYRAPNNPIVDQWILRKRVAYASNQMMPKGKVGAKALIQSLKEKRTTCMLVDQKMNDGISVPFMGREAMTAPAAAQMSIKFDCPLVPYSVVRTHDHHFEIEFFPALEFTPTGNRSEDVRALTLQMNEWLEQHIRKHPSQWLWLHNRWPKK